MKRSTPTPPAPEAQPQRRALTYPPSVWLGRLKQELVAAGLGQDQASLVAVRVLSGLIPQQPKLEAIDRDQI